MVLDNIQIVEALLFASDSPVSGKKLREILPEIGNEKKIKKLISEIDEKYQKNNSPLKIVELAGGYQIVTREEFATWISQLFRARSRAKLTRKGLETLSIIAYKQPITKVEVEKIRGVNSDGVVRTLIERNLITIRGREKAPGNPLLYGTTSYFLEYFGLKSITDLPKLKEVDELLKGDSKFLESLDQVALDQMSPESLGISSMESENVPSNELLDEIARVENESKSDPDEVSEVKVIEPEEVEEEKNEKKSESGESDQ
ncbi:MAG: SMC-Scp complex subunit ScpB [Calditrichaeota bacterium]|nr:MAG: SMC-Scp complex subunit ScpB [Calditrichota bacterium]MBL1206582.1 SMC-Scp complex subunit ScpB [Calditrichota bacterium]NOG46409.1 SMC-Scp complex subunit ScpB [Calditrichota bacterium]